MNKSASPSPFVPGQALTYTVTLSNGGPSDALGASVSDPLPAALAGAGFTWTCAPSTGSSCTPTGSGDITDTVDVLAGGSLTYTVSGLVPPSVQSTLANTATAAPPPGATDPGCTPDCSSSTATTAAPTTGLAVTKVSTPNPYVPGQALTYTVTVTNTGPSDAEGATVSDPLPPTLSGAGFTWTCTPTAGSSCTASGSGDITDTVNVLAGGILTYTVRGTVPSSARDTLDNTATVTPPPGATDTACSPDCSATDTNPPGPAIALSITKTASPSPYVPGRVLTYTVTVANAGPSDATGAQVSDPLTTLPGGSQVNWTCSPGHGSSCSASGSGDINDTVDIPAGSDVTYTVKVTISPATQTTLTNVATVAPPSGVLDPVCTPECLGTSVTPAYPAVNLAVTKTADPTPYTAGKALTYAITVTNGGPSDAVGATVSDPLPAALASGGFTWGCTPSVGSSCTANGSGNITDSVTVAAGGKLTYALKGTVPTGTAGAITNTVAVTPPAGSNDPGCTPICEATSTDTASVTSTAPSATATSPTSPVLAFTGANILRIALLALLLALVGGGLSLAGRPGRRARHRAGR